MANPEHVELVKRGAAAIEEWRDEHGVETLDLSGADFSGLDLCEAKLEKAILTRANLGGANLDGANLDSARLESANLVRSNLTLAELSEANLFRARLSEADLSFAVLNQANLSEANLSNANLSNANLNVANFRAANLRGARLDNATCWSTLFAEIDLSGTTGLDTIEHQGPSAVGIDTLYLSQGKIPEIFLRGCGVPENLIPYIPSMCGGDAIQFYSCFISYNHSDKTFAKQLHDRLQGEGIRCWLDEKQLLPGDNIYHAVEHGIRLWDKVLLCASKDSLTSWWVDNEIVTAFEKEQQLMKQRGREVLALIPLDLDGFMFSDDWQSGYKQQVRKRLAADFQGWKSDHDKFEEQFQRVVKALRTDGGKEPPPEPKL